MHFERAQELETSGAWTAAVEEIMRLGITQPSLWPTALLEVARLVRQHGSREGGLLFGARGLAPESAAWMAARGWTLPQGLFERGDDAPTDVVHDAHVMEKEQGPDRPIAWASTRAEGAEIAAIALMLARRHVRDEALWLAFFNAYLWPHGLAISLHPPRPATRFARLRSDRPWRAIEQGPLVSVLMPVHEAASTLREAAESILGQTWRRLELIMVDDASKDGSWAVCQEIARQDSRVRIHRNPVNVGPYVSKNVAMQIARGDYITCHDADDWAFPDRIAHQIGLLLQPSAPYKATSGRMLRLGPDGDPTRPSRVGPSSEDGFVRPCFVSLMAEREHFRRHLGAWDNIRVAADSELMERAMRAPGGVLDDPHLLMLCLDLEGGLTRHATFGLGSAQRLRPRYLRAWRHAHATLPQRLCYPFLPAQRLFEAPAELVVPRADLENVFTAVGMGLAAAPASAAAPLPLVEEPVVPALHKHNALSEFQQAEVRMGTEPAIEAAERSLVRDLRYAANVLYANAALARGDTSAWLAYLNKYLQRFALAPIRLTRQGGLFARCTTDPQVPLAGTALVSVLMPVRQADDRVHAAIASVLKQTWHHLELLVVHEGDDRTGWEALQHLARSDQRVILLRVPQATGAGVALNAALDVARGDWVATHDACNWMHPQRLERQLAAIEAAGGGCHAAVCHCVPVAASGRIGPFETVGPSSFDGVARRTHGGILVRRSTLIDRVGAWDSVLHGAEEEFLERLLGRLDTAVAPVRQIGGLYLVEQAAEPSHAESQSYRQAWRAWHATAAGHALPFPLERRPFEAPAGWQVPLETQREAALTVASQMKP